MCFSDLYSSFELFDISHSDIFVSSTASIDDLCSQAHWWTILLSCIILLPRMNSSEGIILANFLETPTKGTCWTIYILLLSLVNHGGPVLDGKSWKADLATRCSTVGIIDGIVRRTQVSAQWIGTGFSAIRDGWRFVLGYTRLARFRFTPARLFKFFFFEGLNVKYLEVRSSLMLLF